MSWILLSGDSQPDKFPYLSSNSWGFYSFSVPSYILLR